ncbi:hypothetical protein NFI96_003140 [Prochilodus magdalenae]|nr:hypothetical protein NFI96_003140 [Prochilodus magdalenae]
MHQQGWEFCKNPVLDLESGRTSIQQHHRPWSYSAGLERTSWHKKFTKRNNRKSGPASTSAFTASALVGKQRTDQFLNSLPLLAKTERLTHKHRQKGSGAAGLLVEQQTPAAPAHKRGGAGLPPHPPLNINSSTVEPLMFLGTTMSGDVPWPSKPSREGSPSAQDPDDSTQQSHHSRPEGLVSLHLHPYRTICRNGVRMFKLHGMDYHRTPSGTSTAPYRDVWRVGLANAAARCHTERQTSNKADTCSARAEHQHQHHHHPQHQHRPPAARVDFEMPRGFLVKRSRRAPYGAVYRTRENEHNEHEQPTISTTSSTTAMTTTITARAADDGPLVRAQQQQQPQPQPDLHPREEPQHHPHPSLHHHHHHHHHLQQQLFPARSPVVAESFPLSASSVARALLLQQGHAESAARAHNAHVQSARSRKKPARVARKHQQHLSAEDEESTSPVLGLAILRREKERSPAPGSRAHAGGTTGASGSGGGARPLREFICQLCKEEYADPFALAQHRCSRIVRVEYRCPECAKVFSCPANLASHRRWHRPREQQQQQQQQQQQHGHADHNNNSLGVKHAETSKDSKEEGKENAANRRARKHAGQEEEEGDARACRYCSRTFRTHAHLRKHLTTTTTITTATAAGPHETEQGRYTCGLCRGHARAGAASAATAVAAAAAGVGVGEERALWPGSAHVSVGIGGVGVGVGGIGGGVEFCPSLYSAHGLSAHLSRCHTAESARAALMHVPARPLQRSRSSNHNTEEQASVIPSLSLALSEEENLQQENLHICTQATHTGTVVISNLGSMELRGRGTHLLALEPVLVQRLVLFLEPVFVLVLELVPGNCLFGSFLEGWSSAVRSVDGSSAIRGVGVAWIVGCLRGPV